MENDEEEYVRRDPVRKFQFDHNVSTCLTNKFPDMLVNEEGEDIQENCEFSFAPGEGKVPSIIFLDKDWDIKAWPALHPDGRYGVNHERKINLTDQKYFTQRIRNKDRRFEENPGYVFAATAYIEKKQLQNNANISFSRGKKTQTVDGDTVYSLNDPYTVFDKVKNTPKYWQTYKYEMIAKLENLGAFQWFFTLSCADTRWDENFSSLLEGRGLKIEYNVSVEGKNTTTVVSPGSKEPVPLREYLKNEIDESLHEMIRTNVLNATRNFQHRVLAFLREIVFGENNPMKVKHLSYKIEFQRRGARHIHGVLWSNLSSFEKPKSSTCRTDPKDQTTNRREDTREFKYLTIAFKKMRENKSFKPAERMELEKFIDKFITCSLNPATLAEQCLDGKKLAKLAKEVQEHHHTFTCRKYDTKYRFMKPTFPMKKTTVFGNETNTNDEENSQEEVNHDGILNRVKELLDDHETINEIMGKFNKEEESKEEYIENRSKRIDILLELAGSNDTEYLKALRSAAKKGYTVLLARDIDEGYINPFIPEWLEAWDGNIDTQPCLDFFGVITYVTDYLTKDDTGVAALLKEVQKQNVIKESKEQMQDLIHTFLTHRQMGQSEAYFKLIPSLNMKYSTVKSVFVPTDKKELRSKFLKKIDDKEDAMGKIAFEVAGREGLFIEKADLIDKYIRRPGSKNPYQKLKETETDLEDLVGIHFAKMFEVTQKAGTDDTLDIENLDFDDDDLKFHYIMRSDESKKKTLLPDYIKLSPKFPGENNVMKKRRFQAAAHFHKKRENLDPHKFFLSELMLYYPFRDEKNDLHSDNEELCAQLYMQEFDNIKSVKSQVMEHLENVEEARFMVEEYARNEDKMNEIGEDLDPENEQDISECLFEEQQLHPDFEHLDPRKIKELNTENVRKEKLFKKIEIGNIEELRELSIKMDKYQKVILEIAIRYARYKVKALKQKNKRPIPTLLMVHGGAGSGKSTVISVLARWCHHILQKPGDDPDCPYIVISAFTGSAACNVNGQTLHSLFSFNFGSEFITLSEKIREEKRKNLRNLHLLIIDEIL